MIAAHPKRLRAAYRNIRKQLARIYGDDQSDAGSSIVEFAFVAPVFLILLFGIVDFGRALFDYDLVANAARLGARYAIVHGATCNNPAVTCTMTPISLQTYVTKVSPGVSGITASASYLPMAICPISGGAAANPSYPLSNGPGCEVTVTVTYPFEFAAFISTGFTMTSSSTMTISQ